MSKENILKNKNNIVNKETVEQDNFVIYEVIQKLIGNDKQIPTLSDNSLEAIGRWTEIGVDFFGDDFLTEYEVEFDKRYFEFFNQNNDTENILTIAMILFENEESSFNYSKCLRKKFNFLNNFSWIKQFLSNENEFYGELDCLNMFKLQPYSWLRGLIIYNLKEVPKETLKQKLIEILIYCNIAKIFKDRFL